MHASAMRTGRKFIEIYWEDRMKSILEVGSYNVNGSIRDFQPPSSDWTGIDIEEGPGVDLVIEPWTQLPFSNNHFDLVLASSVFEHDVKFWKTLDEMSRTLSKDGFVYISSPSNGYVHTWPVDSFRFYPDAAKSFLEVIRERHPNAEIVESFIGAQDEGIWNDFVCVISANGGFKPNLISDSERHELPYIRGKRMFANGDYPCEDQRKYQELHSQLKNLRDEHLDLITYLNKVLDSRIWKLAKALRLVR